MSLIIVYMRFTVWKCCPKFVIYSASIMWSSLYYYPFGRNFSHLWSGPRWCIYKYCRLKHNSCRKDFNLSGYIEPRFSIPLGEFETGRGILKLGRIYPWYVGPRFIILGGILGGGMLDLLHRSLRKIAQILFTSTLREGMLWRGGPTHLKTDYKLMILISIYIYIYIYIYI